MKLSVLFLSVFLLISITGCDRHIESRDPIRSLPSPPLIPTDLEIMVNDLEIILSWQITSTSGIARYRVFLSESPDRGFTLVDSSQTTSVTIEGLPADKVFYFQVAALSTDGIEGHRSETISVQTGTFGISIDGNQRFTDSREVSIRSASGVATSAITLSEQSNFSDSLVLPYSTTVNYLLSDGDGVKTVYARFLFADGSRSGNPVSDDIILDTRAQIVSLTFTPADSLLHDGDTVTFFLNAGESEGTASVSIGGTTKVVLHNNATNGDISSSDNIFTGRFVVPSGFVIADGEITGTFTDEAGNQSEPYISSLRLDVVGSLLPVDLVLAEALSSFKIGIAWTRSTMAGFADYRVFRSTTSNVTKASKLMALITNVGTTTYTDTTLVDFTRYYYRIYVRDNLGRDTASNIMSAVTLVNQSPQPVTVAGTLSDGSTAVLTWSVNADDDFASYRIFRDQTEQVSPFDPMVGYISNRNTTTFADFIPTSWSGAYYRVYVYDKHGVESASNLVHIVK